MEDFPTPEGPCNCLLCFSLSVSPWILGLIPSPSYRGIESTTRYSSSVDFVKFFHYFFSFLHIFLLVQIISVWNLLLHHNQKNPRRRKLGFGILHGKNSKMPDLRLQTAGLIAGIAAGKNGSRHRLPFSSSFKNGIPHDITPPEALKLSFENSFQCFFTFCKYHVSFLLDILEACNSSWIIFPLKDTNLFSKSKR